jgi:prepilin-type N-terminal cleavage/methylation domain-containing protein/prepilin-type processing-associated H-X9-DG protein
MKKRNAFTLIELLVVIAIIGLLLAVILPSLKKAKDVAKRAVCLAHLHSLGVSWVTYADENDGHIVNAKTARLNQISTNPRTFSMSWGPSQYHNEPTWVGWFTEPVDAYGEFIVDEQARKACIELGTMFPYNETLGIYRCPVGIRNEQRTYAITDAMNGHEGFESVGGRVVRKLVELKSPGTRLVFIDEGWATTESWTINPHIVKWWDRVPVRHGDGTTVTMADGSAEYWKWRDQRTIDFANGNGDDTSTAQNNVDFDKIQRAAWGKSTK